MKTMLSMAIALAMTTALSGAAMAQPRDDHRDNQNTHAMSGPPHHDWHKGGKIEQSDWKRGKPVDYRSHHLAAPGRGQEWREVDGNYVLAAAATGLIAGIALSH
jgi:Ni/Co efflux regulator RcnB